METPYGYCHCGCGGKTTVSTRTDTNAGIIKGAYKKYIQFHAAKVNAASGENHYRWNGGKRISRGYILIKMADHPRADFHGYVPEHVLVAEKSIGGYLPDGAEVHHKNGVKSDNAPTNLVICKNHSEHIKMHEEEKALKGCGNPEYRKCCFCKEWDSVDNMNYDRKQRKYRHTNHKREFKPLSKSHKENISKSHKIRFERIKNGQ